MKLKLLFASLIPIGIGIYKYSADVIYSASWPGLTLMLIGTLGLIILFGGKFNKQTNNSFNSAIVTLIIIAFLVALYGGLISSAAYAEFAVIYAIYGTVAIILCLAVFVIIRRLMQHK